MLNCCACAWLFEASKRNCSDDFSVPHSLTLNYVAKALSIKISDTYVNKCWLFDMHSVVCMLFIFTLFRRISTFSNIKEILSWLKCVHYVTNISFFDGIEIALSKMKICTIRIISSFTNHFIILRHPTMTGYDSVVFL